MNNFSRSVPCTWMTIIDCLFYASYLELFHGSIFAKLLVEWLY